MLKYLRNLFTEQSQTTNTALISAQHDALVTSINLLSSAISFAEEAKLLELPEDATDEEVDKVCFNAWEQAVPKQTQETAKSLVTSARNTFSDAGLLDTHEAEALGEELAWTYYITRATHFNHGYEFDTNSIEDLHPENDFQIPMIKENLDLLHDLAQLQVGLYESLIDYAGLDPTQFDQQTVFKIMSECSGDDADSINNTLDFWQWMQRMRVNVVEKEHLPPHKQNLTQDL